MTVMKMTERIMEDIATINNRLKAIEAYVNALSKIFTGLTIQMEAMNKRLDTIEKKLDKISEKRGLPWRLLRRK